MSILQMLAQAAGQDSNPDVVVNAERKRTIPEDTRMEPGPRKTDELVQRKGMFGLKGTLRDVLGTLGDAFLVQGGGQAIYRPQREKEKLSSALYGFTDDPKAAIERAALENPEFAAGLNNQYQNQETQRLRNSQLAAAQQAAISQKGYGIAGSLARTIKDPDSYAKAKPILERMKAQYGLDFDVPDEYDEDALTGIYTRGLSPDQIADNERADLNFSSQDKQRQAATRIAQERAGETARHNRVMESKNTSRPAPKATASNIDAEVLAKVRDGTASPNERKYYEERLKKGKPSRRAPPPLPPGFTLKKTN